MHVNRSLLRFQEVVPLRTANVLGLDNKKVCKKWNSLIRKALNKKTCCSQEAKHAAEFRCLISKQMVGIFISVWIRGDLHPYIRNLNLSCVGCGIMGCLGNKVFTLHAFMKHNWLFFQYQNTEANHLSSWQSCFAGISFCKISATWNKLLLCLQPSSFRGQSRRRKTKELQRDWYFFKNKLS